MELMMNVPVVSEEEHRGGGCKGWVIQEQILNEECWREYQKRNGRIWCDVHNCDAWECFTDNPDPTLDK